MTKRARPARKTHEVDPADRTRNLGRLLRIEGQVRGLQKMVEEDRYCADVLMQLSAVHEALRGVGREVMRHHLRHCATAAIKGTPAQGARMHDEILELMFKHLR